ncbi:hypothetical protein [Oryzihumus sp.]|uniref:hypothetical protein n=1 Tax=Oryzihumus sp. TaxID=1968903 RepID=UPI002ED840DF
MSQATPDWLIADNGDALPASVVEEITRAGGLVASDAGVMVAADLWLFRAFRRAGGSERPSARASDIGQSRPGALLLKGAYRSARVSCLHDDREPEPDGRGQTDQRKRSVPEPRHGDNESDVDRCGYGDGH